MAATTSSPYTVALSSLIRSLSSATLLAGQPLPFGGSLVRVLTQSFTESRSLGPLHFLRSLHDFASRAARASAKQAGSVQWGASELQPLERHAPEATRTTLPP